METPYDQEEAKLAFNTIKSSMQLDCPGEKGSLAHGWHCNIAMACYDEIREALDEVPHEQAHIISNEVASRFMKLCFDVETSA